MSKRLRIILFSFTILIAIVLRFYRFGEVPLSPNWDEVSLGYNAYSILKTGHDEYGSFLPTVLRSYDDYKPALYSYFVIPSILVQGLTVEAVRTPSAVLGVLTVIAAYLIVKELLKGFYFKGKDITEYLALASMLMLSISPWHIQFSRIAFESNAGVALNVFALLFFLKGIRNPKFLLLSFALGALNIHMYQSNRVFTPLMLFAVSLIYYKQLYRIKKWFLISVVIAFIITLPFIHYTLTNQNALLRAKGVSIFSSQELIARSTDKLVYDKENSNILGIVLNNRRGEFVKSTIAGYISHFDLNWLFITGDIARHHAPNMGLLYLFEFPFLFVGIYTLLFGKYNKKSKLIIFSYFLIAPIPASITSGVPHAVRTLNFIPFIHVFSAVGIVYCFFILRGIKFNLVKYTVVGFASIFALLNFSYYLNQYFVQQNYAHAKEWLFGYEEAIESIQESRGEYESIVVSNDAPLDQSYMFFLFYTKFDPLEYQKSGGTKTGGFAENHDGFQNFTFRPIKWDKETKDRQTLYIGSSKDFPPDVKTLKTVFYPNGEAAVKIVE